MSGSGYWRRGRRGRQGWLGRRPLYSIEVSRGAPSPPSPLHLGRQRRNPTAAQRRRHFLLEIHRAEDAAERGHAGADEELQDEHEDEPERAAAATEILHDLAHLRWQIARVAQELAHDGT